MASAKIKVVSVLSFFLAGLCSLLVHCNRQSMTRLPAAPCRSHEQPVKHNRLSTMMASCPVHRRALPCPAVRPSSPPVAAAAAVVPSCPPPCVCCPSMRAQAGLCLLQPRRPQLLLAPALRCPPARPLPRPTLFWPRPPWASFAVASPAAGLVHRAVASSAMDLVYCGLVYRGPHLPRATSAVRLVCCGPRPP